MSRRGLIASDQLTQALITHGVKRVKTELQRPRIPLSLAIRTPARQAACSADVPRLPSPHRMR